MRIIRLVLVTMALVSGTLFLGAASAAVPRTTPFVAVVSEDFSPSCAVDTCGTAVTRYGPATVSTVITVFEWLSGDCFIDQHTSTLSFADGSNLALDIAGTFCVTDESFNFRFSGTYTVSQALSTGRFSGAAGSGRVAAFRINGPIHAVFAGTVSR